MYISLLIFVKMGKGSRKGRKGIFIKKILRGGE
jgi:hypothetical protein